MNLNNWKKLALWEMKWNMVMNWFLRLVNHRNPYYAADRIGVLLRDIEPNHQSLSAVFSFLRLIFHPDQCRGEACVLERAWGMLECIGSQRR